MQSTLKLAYDLQSASVARRFVRQFVSDDRPDSNVDIHCVIASELVTNAVLHGSAPVEITLERQAGDLTIEVADGDPRVGEIRLRQVDETGPGGRGLRIVAELADRWGARTFRSGKAVWATVALAPTPAASRPIRFFASSRAAAEPSSRQA